MRKYLGFTLTELFMVMFIVLFMATGAMASGELFVNKTFDIENGNKDAEVSYSLDGKYTAPEIGKIRPFVEARLDFGDSITDYVSGKYKLGGEIDVTDTFIASADFGKVFDPDNTERSEFNLTGYFDMSDGITLKTGYTWNEYPSGPDGRKLDVGIGYKFK